MSAYIFEASVRVGLNNSVREVGQHPAPYTDRAFDLLVDVPAEGDREATDRALVAALEQALERARAMAAE